MVPTRYSVALVPYSADGSDRLRVRTAVVATPACRRRVRREDWKPVKKNGQTGGRNSVEKRDRSFSLPWRWLLLLLMQPMLVSLAATGGLVVKDRNHSIGNVQHSGWIPQHCPSEVADCSRRSTYCAECCQQRHMVLRAVEVQQSCKSRGTG